MTRCTIVLHPLECVDGWTADVIDGRDLSKGAVLFSSRIYFSPVDAAIAASDWLEEQLEMERSGER